MPVTAPENLPKSKLKNLRTSGVLFLQIWECFLHLINDNMIKQLETAEFLNSFQENVLIDVRSEAEYQQGHIPAAVNIPILNDEHRKLVGLCYKQKGREEAVKLGFELVGPLFSILIEKVSTIALQKKLSIYCWRGGMRSNIMAWVLNLSGFKINLLKGGYKKYRKLMLETLERNDFEMIILGGRTGSGKTEILNELSCCGHQVVDLEGYAHHKGSAFGGLGQLPQPTQEQFENFIAHRLYYFDKSKPVFFENESRLIGKRHLPNTLYDSMRAAKVIEIQLSMNERIKRILKEYGHFSSDELCFHTRRIEKRLGNLRMRNAIEAIENNNLETWVKIMISYYDDLYEHSNSQRSKETIFQISIDVFNKSEISNTIQYNYLQRLI